MTKTRIFKIIIAITLAVAMFMILSQTAFALNFNIDEKFVGTGDKGNTTNTVAGIIGSVISFYQIIATGIAILTLIIIAGKWIYASPSNKVQMAKTIRYYILGAIIIFTSATLLQIIKKFAVKSFYS